MIHKIILTWLNHRRSREIDSIRFAHSLNLIVGSCESNYFGVEFGKIFAENGGSVASGITGYEEGGYDVADLFLYHCLGGRGELALGAGVQGKSR